MTCIKIKNKFIGLDYPVYIIAEACDNHMGNIDTAIEMIKKAKLAGADAIKFQHHLPDEEMLPDTPMSDNFDEPLYEFLKNNALTLDQHKTLKQICDDLEITYLCTPFSLAAAYELETINCYAYKIGSGEMTDIPTLKKIAELNKPMIISTGMSTFEEIDKTYNSLVPYKLPMAFLNCVSEYPPNYEDVNLKVINEMQKRYEQCTIGHSDHTPDLYTTFAAVALGAKIVEKHVIIDKRTPGPDQSVSINFDELTDLVNGIRKIELSLGNNKQVNHKEKQIREWAFRSIVSTQNIYKGEKISNNMIWSKRPGTGIPSNKMDKIIGLTANRDILKNTMLKWSDFAENVDDISK